MGTRYPKEYCPHCREMVWCVFRGPRLYCQHHDHFVRNRNCAKRVPPKPTPDPDHGEIEYNLAKAQRYITLAMRGEQDWEDVAKMCTDMKLHDLAVLCEDLRQVDEHLAS